MKIALITMFYNRLENGMVFECIKGMIDAKKPEVDYHYFIVNNGSTESDARLIEYLNSTGIEYTYMRNEVNQGTIQGSMEVIGKIIDLGYTHIAGCDSDDIWKEEYLIKLWNRMQETGAHMVGSYYEKFGNDSGIIKWEEGVSAMEMFTRGAPPSSGLYTIEYFTKTGGFKPEMKFANDFELHLHAALIGMKYAMVQEPLYRYRLHGVQETNGKWGDDNAWKRLAYKVNGINYE